MDDVSGRLNTDERGTLLGAFDTGDQLLLGYEDGSYELTELDLNRKFEPKELFYIGKYDPELVLTAVYYEGERKLTLVKRFLIETSTLDTRYPFISEHKQSKLFYASAAEEPVLKYSIRDKGKKIDKEVELADFIDVKGWKSLGNKLEEGKIASAKDATVAKAPAKPKSTAAKSAKPPAGGAEAGKVKAGDVIDFDLEENGQKKLFED
jgi:topoisomerase-4 subunit A